MCTLLLLLLLLRRQKEEKQEMLSRQVVHSRGDLAVESLHVSKVPHLLMLLLLQLLVICSGKIRPSCPTTEMCGKARALSCKQSLLMCRRCCHGRVVSKLLRVVGPHRLLLLEPAAVRCSIYKAHKSDSQQ